MCPSDKEYTMDFTKRVSVFLIRKIDLLEIYIMNW